MPVIAQWHGRSGKVIHESVGRVLVDFGDYQQWILKGLPDLTLIVRNRGRPPKFESNAARQRAYRERKAGKALRKYTKQS